MKPLTMNCLLGPYAREPWTPAELASGRRLVVSWNNLAAHAEDDGVVLPINEITGTHVGGQGNGGARPKGSKVGAPGSRHQLLLALDWYDPERNLMRWILTYGLDVAAGLGMYFEHPQWTRSWAHGQIVAPGDGLDRWNIFFVPYLDIVANPTTCHPLPEQMAANCPTFAYKAAA